MINSRFLSFQPDWEFSRRREGVKAALRQAPPGLDPLSASAGKKVSGRKEKCVFFVGPINLKSVTYVPERLLPFSPVQTSRRREGVKAALRQAPPGLDPLSASGKKVSGRKEKCMFFVGPIKIKSVTYVPEHLLPFSPVQTGGLGWG